MNPIFRAGAGLLAAASLALTPVQAAAKAKDYDPVVYNLLLDCAAMQILFAQVSDTKEDKEASTNRAVGFISAANALSGEDLKDFKAALDPRMTKITNMITSKDPMVDRLVGSCAAIERVGRDAIAVSKS